MEVAGPGMAGWGFQGSLAWPLATSGGAPYPCSNFKVPKGKRDGGVDTDP